MILKGVMCMANRMFEYYVLNYNSNKQKVEMYNVFNNIRVSESVEKEIKKYLRSPKNYTYTDFQTEEKIYGFDALCKEIDRTIAWQEWSRREYEISVGDAFETDCSKLEKWDCYSQCKPNIPMITRELIYQYKNKNNGDK